GREGDPHREPGADGRRGARRVVGQSLPLHRLHEDRRGRAGRGAGLGVRVRLHPFGLVEPESLREALDVFAKLDGEARFVAGGTALIPMIRLGLVKPDRLISLNRLAALTEIRLLDDGLLGVRVPPPPKGARSGYSKFTARSAEDKALVGVAALIVLDGGRCTEARIGLGGVAPTPVRARRAEATLRGEVLSNAAVRAAAEAAAAEAEPLSDLMGSADYRREMIRVWVRRLLVALRDGTR